MPRSTCSSCNESVYVEKIRLAPCGHRYCKDCVYRMSRLALLDRMLCPVRCCKKELPIEYVKEVLIKKEDFEKYANFFQSRDWKNSDLVSDAEYQCSVQLVNAKQCPGCGIGVERDFGCIHMKCPNGHEFCFTCLGRWKSCECQLIPETEIRSILNERTNDVMFS